MRIEYHPESQEIKKVLSLKTSKKELNNTINIKVNTTEVMRAINDLSSSIEHRATIELY